MSHSTPLCPHCSYQHADAPESMSTDMIDQCGVMNCKQCGKPFTWYSEVDVTFVTYTPEQIVNRRETARQIRAILRGPE